MNELAWMLGMGRQGDITSRPLVYIGIRLWRQRYHLNNTTSIKGVLQYVDELAR